MPFRRRVTWILSALPALAPLAPAQSLNNLVLHNGGDALAYISDPSLGFQTGTYPPDIANGDWWFKTYPKEILTHPLSSMELTGFVLAIYDTDWVATPNPRIHDMMLAPAKVGFGPCDASPDFASQDAVFVSLGALGLPNPEPGGGCPAPGFVVGYVLDVVVASPVPGSGISLRADGLTDWTWTAFVPGGMTLSGGTCGLGDYLLEDLRSATEHAPDLCFSGENAFSGYHPGASGVGFVSDPLNEVFAGELQFRDPTTQPTVDVGSGVEAGLASLFPSVNGGASTLGMRYHAAEQVGERAFFFGSTFPLLPSPGVPIFDIHVLVNLADPLAAQLANIWTGTIGLVSQGGLPFDDGVFDSAQIHIPPVAVGFTLAVQGFNLNPVTLDFDDGQAVLVTLLP